MALAAALSALVASGFSELYDVMQMRSLICAFLAVLAFSSHTSKRNLLWLVAAGLLGSALSLTIVILAPGNKIRAADFPPPPHWVAQVGLALQLTSDFLRATLLRYLLNLLAAFIMSATLGSGLLFGDGAVVLFPLRDLARALLWTPVVVLGPLVSGFAAAAYELSGAPPARALIMP